MNRQQQSLRTQIDNDRQRFVDEPVYAEISKAKPLAVAISQGLTSIDRATGRHIGTNIAPSIFDVSHYERVQLRWMRPDGKGGLVPKYRSGR